MPTGYLVRQDQEIEKLKLTIVRLAIIQNDASSLEKDIQRGNISNCLFVQDILNEHRVTVATCHPSKSATRQIEIRRKRIMQEMSELCGSIQYGTEFPEKAQFSRIMYTLCATYLM